MLEDMMTSGTGAVGAMVQGRNSLVGAQVRPRREGAAALEGEIDLEKDKTHRVFIQYDFHGRR